MNDCFISATDAAAAKEKLTAISAQLEKWEAGVTALAAAPPPEEKKPAAKPAGRPAAKR